LDLLVCLIFHDKPHMLKPYTTERIFQNSARICQYRKES
jgi:hypothetical protein